jgi:MarR family transcriptional regulator, organic hydroperoxide resistance regulator
MSRTATAPRHANETLRFMKALWALVHGLDVRSKWMERNLGVTGPQRLVLRIVGRTPGVGASDIATSLDLHPSTLTGILARLEKRGYLTRDIDPSDRRRARFRLTPRGARVDRERRGTVEAAVRRALARASDADIARTESLLGLLTGELERDE